MLMIRRGPKREIFLVLHLYMHCAVHPWVEKKIDCFVRSFTTDRFDRSDVKSTYIDDKLRAWRTWWRKHI